MNVYRFTATLLSGMPLESFMPYPTKDATRPYEQRLKRFVFDYATIIRKENVDMDDNHNSSEIIGRTDRIWIQDGKMLGEGRLFSSGGDRAERIALLAKNGVLFGISPKVSFLNAKALEIDEGESIVVNGIAYDGPITAVANAEILGFGVCPYATDRGTNFKIRNENENL